MIPMEVDAGLTNVGTVLTQIWSWVTSAFTTITSQPILLIGLSVFLAFAIIRLVYSMIKG